MAEGLVQPTFAKRGQAVIRGGGDELLTSRAEAEDQERTVGDDLAFSTGHSFFCALVAYDLFLLKQYEVAYWNFGFAVLNALVITKVIMIGEYAKLGERHEDKSVLISTVWKALVFGLLVFAFRIVEEIIKRMIHGADLTRASRDIRLDQLAFRKLVFGAKGAANHDVGPEGEAPHLS